MAASGNFLTDILSSFKLTDKKEIRLSQLVTLVIGAAAVWIALQMHSVLDLMLYSYAFMVSGMFVPVVALLVLKKPSPLAAFASMIAGGTCTLVLILSNIKLPWDMDANFFGILLATIVFIILQLKFNLQKKTN
jgi:SSS family solute:Na+ symporter